MISGHDFFSHTGLQLIEKTAVSQIPFKCFSYATSPIPQEPVTVEKAIIWHRPYPIQSEHVRCHMLTPDDNIPELIVQYSKQDAQAVVLINTANNYSWFHIPYFVMQRVQIFLFLW